TSSTSPIRASSSHSRSMYTPVPDSGARRAYVMSIKTRTARNTKGPSGSRWASEPRWCAKAAEAHARPRGLARKAADPKRDPSAASPRGRGAEALLVLQRLEHVQPPGTPRGEDRRDDAGEDRRDHEH